MATKASDRRRRLRRCRSACREPSTSTSSCSSTCRRSRSRATSPASSTLLYARDCHAPPTTRRARRSQRFHGGVAPRRGSAPDRRCCRNQPVPRGDAGVPRSSKLAADARTATARCSITSLVLYGSNMGNSNQHVHYDVPMVLVGGGVQDAQGRSVTSGCRTQHGARPDIC